MLLSRIRDLSSPERPLSDRVGSLLIPRVFLVSVTVGFLFASVLGYFSTKRPPFQNFVRVHQLIGSESFLNVTASQLWRLVEALPPDKVLVIIGGTSRFNGVGQTPLGLWSQHLQQMLGPHYRVINLALRAGQPDQFGSYAAEAMIKEGRRVIYLADVPLFYSPTGIGTFPAYRYLFFDARAQGLLIKSRARDAIVNRLAESPANKIEFQELYLRAALNRFAYFDDLWNYAGYWHLFVGAWSSLALPSPMEARVYKKDPEERSAPPGGYYSQYEFGVVMNLYRGETRKVENGTLAAVESSLKTIPYPLIARSIWVTIYHSPYYIDQYANEEQLAHTENYIAMDGALRRAGYASLILGPGWNADDFVDGAHLSEKGGRKLAEAVAPLVVQKAASLGYLK